MLGNEDEVEGARESCFVFRMGETPATLRNVLLDRGWDEFDPDTAEEDGWNLMWRSSRFKPSDYTNANGAARACRVRL